MILGEQRLNQSSIERSVREGLSSRDATLPIGQNIARVYNHTPELQWLGEAIVSEDETRLRQAIQRASESAQMFYGLDIVLKSDAKIARITGDPHNKATLRGKKILMSISLTDDPCEMAIELAHELGAARLISIYGNKRNLPDGLPDPDGGTKPSAATHYLDWFVQSNGTDQEPIEMARKYSWESGQLVKNR